MNAGRFASAVVVVGSALAAVTYGQAHIDAGRYVRGQYGAESVRAIRDAEQLVIYRINPDDFLTNPEPDGPTRILGYRVLGEPTRASPSVLRRLRTFLLSDGSYDDAGQEEGTIHLCAFSPGVAFRLSRSATESFDVLVCLLCDELAFQTTTGISPKVAIHRGRAQLLKILALGLPNDEEIKALAKSKRPPNN